MKISEIDEMVSSNDIVEVLGEKDEDLERFVKLGTLMAKTGYEVSPKMLGYVMTNLAFRLMRIEQAIGASALHVHRAESKVPRDSQKSQKSPEPLPASSDGVMHERALALNLPDDLQPGDKVEIPCPVCFGKMTVKKTRDGSRYFISCDNYDKTGCKGSISYKSFEKR
jgi:hypothetical protein